MLQRADQVSLLWFLRLWDLTNPHVVIPFIVTYEFTCIKYCGSHRNTPLGWCNNLLSSTHNIYKNRVSIQTKKKGRLLHLPLPLALQLGSSDHIIQIIFSDDRNI